MHPRARRGSAPTTADPAERAREIALRLLTHSPRSAAQLREGLLAREVADEVAEEVIARYREVGLLDDAALAAALVRTRHRERGQSRRAIAHELRRKGFGAEDLAHALSEVSDEDERAMAQALATSRWERLSGVAPEARARRVAAMLGRKGYPSSVAFALVKRLRTADIWDTRYAEPTEEA